MLGSSTEAPQVQRGARVAVGVVQAGNVQQRRGLLQVSQRREALLRLAARVLAPSRADIERRARTMAKSHIRRLRRAAVAWAVAHGQCYPVVQVDVVGGQRPGGRSRDPRRQRAGTRRIRRREGGRNIG